MNPFDRLRAHLLSRAFTLGFLASRCMATGLPLTLAAAASLIFATLGAGAPSILV